MDGAVMEESSGSGVLNNSAVQFRITTDPDHDLSTVNGSFIEPLSSENRQILVGVISFGTAIGFAGNLSVLAYIVYRRLYRNFVSSHFIAHLTFVNVLTCCYLLPVFIQNLSSGQSLFGPTQTDSETTSCPFACRLHAFVLCMFWTVTHYMIACISGVHLLTFARIHYEQLFGLSPTIICALSWLIGSALGLPCITNWDLVNYNPSMYHCMWQDKKIGYHFLAYMVLLGLLLPLGLTFYAYGRILTIFYHSPVVFEALGIFRARYLIFAFLINSLTQVPFYIIFMINPTTIINPSLVLPLVAFLAYSMSITNFVLYGVALFIMKEDDMALTHKAQKHTYVQPGVQPEHI